MKSPLHRALLEGDDKSAEVCLSNPSATDWCRKQYRGYTPIAIACKKSLDDRLILQILARCPMAASIPTKEDQGDYPVHLCAKYGNMSSAVIEALLMEYPHAIDHKSFSSIGVLMTPEQLARGNSRLSEASRLALQQPTSHWLRLKSYIKSASDRESADLGLNSPVQNSCNLRSPDKNSSREARHLCNTLQKVQGDLIDSKNTEAILLSKLNALENKIERLTLSADRNERRFRGVRKMSRMSSVESVVGNGRLARRDSAYMKAAERRGSITSQRRGSISSKHNQELEVRGTTNSKRRSSIGSGARANRRSSMNSSSQQRRGSMSAGNNGRRRRTSIGGLFSKVKNEVTTNAQLQQKAKTAVTSAAKYVAQTIIFGEDEG